MLKVSIIIPVYNTAEYLDQCLNSILNQSLKELEIIIINDGSTDDSTEILRKYKEKHPEIITLIEQENQGMSVARNKGIDLAKGKYLGFVDSDDWINEDMYFKMVSLAEQNESDIVICNTVDHHSDYKVHHEAAKFTSKFTVTPSACNKLFLRSYIGNLRFPPGLWYEDFCFTSIALLDTEKISTIEEYFYNCHVRPVSIMTNHNSTRNLDIIAVLEIIKKHMKDSNQWELYKNTFQYLIIDHILITSINRVSVQKNKISKEVISKLRSYAKKQNLDFNQVQNEFNISSKRILIAKLNYYGLNFISKAMLKLTSMLKGR